MHIITTGCHVLFNSTGYSECCMSEKDLLEMPIDDDELIAVMLDEEAFINVSDYESGAYIKYMRLNQARAEADWYKNDKITKNYYVNGKTFILPASYAKSLLSDDLDIDTICDTIPVVRRPNVTRIIPLSEDKEKELYELFIDYLECNCRDEKIAADIDFIIKEVYPNGQSKCSHKRY